MGSRSLVALGATLALCTHTLVARADDAAPPSEADQVALQQAKIDYEKSKLDYAKSALSVTPGSTELKDGAGIAEEFILSDQLMVGLAKSATKTLKTLCKDTSTLVLYVGSDKPSSIDKSNIDAQTERLNQQYVSAAATLAAADKEYPRTLIKKSRTRSAFVGALGAAGIALNVLSLLKTDYALGGNAIEPDQQQFALEIASAIKKLPPTDAFNPAIYLSGDFPTSALVAANMGGYTEKLKRITDNQDLAVKALAAVNLRAKELADEKNAEGNSAYTAAGAALAAYIADAKAFIASLVTTDSKGSTPLARAAAQKYVADHPAAVCQVGVRLHHLAGSHYTKSSIGTFFGGMPFYASAVVTASLTVWNADSALKGSVVASKAMPFTRFKEIAVPEAEQEF